MEVRAAGFRAARVRGMRALSRGRGARRGRVGATGLHGAGETPTRRASRLTREQGAARASRNTLEMLQSPTTVAARLDAASRPANITDYLRSPTDTLAKAKCQEAPPAGGDAAPLKRCEAQLFGGPRESVDVEPAARTPHSAPGPVAQVGFRADPIHARLRGSVRRHVHRAPVRPPAHGLPHRSGSHKASLYRRPRPVPGRPGQQGVRGVSWLQLAVASRWRPAPARAPAAHAAVSRQAQAVVWRYDVRDWPTGRSMPGRSAGRFPFTHACRTLPWRSSCASYSAWRMRHACIDCGRPWSKRSPCSTWEIHCVRSRGGGVSAAFAATSWRRDRARSRRPPRSGASPCGPRAPCLKYASHVGGVLGGVSSRRDHRSASPGG